jgi:DDE family transposase
MILRGHKLSIQTALNKLFAYFGREGEVPTPSAYCHARRKLDPALFHELLAQVSGQFYALWGEEGEVRLWNRMRVKAVDGSRLTLPDTPETRARYTVQENQFPGAACVQGMVSVCYDVLNEVALSVGLREVCAEKEFLWGAHEAAIGPEDLVVLDRRYMDYSVLAWLEARARAYLVRCPSKGFGEVERFWRSAATDAVVTLRVTASARALVAERDLARELRVRLVKVELETGETEVLATSLLRAERVSRDDLKAVYWMRWGVETFYDRIKDVYEAERMSGERVHRIEQDVYGVVFLATLESIVGKEAEQELAERSRERGHRYLKQVNHAVSYSAMVDTAVEWLCDEGVAIEEVYERLRALFKTNPTSQRPGRKHPRTPALRSRRLRYYRYRKRLAI